MEYQEILAGIREVGIFDFIANNYWKLTKEDLRTICMELDFAILDSMHRDEYDKIANTTLEALEDIWS